MSQINHGGRPGGPTPGLPTFLIIQKVDAGCLPSEVSEEGFLPRRTQRGVAG